MKKRTTNRAIPAPEIIQDKKLMAVHIKVIYYLSWLLDKLSRYFLAYLVFIISATYFGWIIFNDTQNALIPAVLFYVLSIVYLVVVKRVYDRKEENEV